jgi:hypothetical protein
MAQQPQIPPAPQDLIALRDRVNEFVELSGLTRNEKERVQGKLLDATQQTYINIYDMRRQKDNKSFDAILRGYIRMFTIHIIYLCSY